CMPLLFAKPGCVAGTACLIACTPVRQETLFRYFANLRVPGGEIPFQVHIPAKALNQGKFRPV
ncbi:MAG: hypothetical protein WC029_02015, partial [Sulfuricella sp.]